MSASLSTTLMTVKTLSETYSVSFGEIKGIETTETPVGSVVGRVVGSIVGEDVGTMVGEGVGSNVGEGVGPIVGEGVGPIVGEPVGSTVMLLVEQIGLEKKLITSKGSKLRNFIAVLYRVKVR